MAAPSQRRIARISAAAAGADDAAVVAALEEWVRLDWEPWSTQELLALRAQGEQGRAELEDRLLQRLEFGTAGLRGVMAAGFNRLNHLSVVQATQGLAVHALATVDDAATRGVVVAFDARHTSDTLATLVAATLVARGLRVFLLRGTERDRYAPTPLLAFAVASLHCAAGVMVTASHNPKQYNGYKVYWGNGCQIIPPVDQGIAAAIEANLTPWERPASVVDHPLVSNPMATLSEQYLVAVGGLRRRERAANAAAPPLVYTPLHGVGLPLLRRAFHTFGLPPPLVVAAQAEPDPEFSTVAFPNPEEGRATWALALAMADAGNVGLVMANDPDADRLAAAVWLKAPPSTASEAAACLPSTQHGGGGVWRPLSGNEIGALLAHWVWTHHHRRGAHSKPAAMLASTVSSKLLARMAAAEGFRFQETLTGFKWLGNVAHQLEAQGYDVLFGYEEAIGFMFPGVHHDKDGVAAACVFAELAAHAAENGGSVYELLRSLHVRYGAHATRQHYFVARSSAAMASVFARLRRDAPVACGPFRVTAVKDLGTGVDTGHASGQVQLPWTPGDLHICYTLDCGAEVTVRASGTEPKLKYYLEVQGATWDEAWELASRVEAAVVQHLINAEQSGLTRGPPP